MFSSPDPDDHSADDQVMSDLLEKFQDDARKLGLYMNAAFMRREPDIGLAPGEKPVTQLIVTFNVGDVAFSDRVLNPEKDEVEDQFRGIEHGMIRDQVEGIKDSGRDLLASLQNLDEEEEDEGDG